MREELLSREAEAQKNCKLQSFVNDILCQKYFENFFVEVPC